MRHANKVLLVFAVLAVIAGLYAGAYLLMLDKVGYELVVTADGGLRSTPYYHRYDGPLTHMLLGPAHAVDRLLRPEMWKPLPVPRWPSRRTEDGKAAQIEP